MPNIYKEIFLKQKNNKVRVQTTQYSNAIGMTFRIADWEIPAGAVATVYIQKPSGAEVFSSGTIDGNTITFPMTTQTTAEVGIAEGQVKISASGAVQNSFLFSLEVQKCIIDDEAIESQDEFDALNTLLNTVSSKITACETATQTALDAASAAREPVQVGARNLLLNTDVDGEAVYAQGAAGPYGSTFASNTYGILTATSTGSAFYYFFGQNVSTTGGWGLYCFEPGAYYYITGEIKSPVTGTAYINERKPANNRLTSFETTANTWTKFSLMFQVPSNASDYMIGLAQSASSGSSYQLRNLQLEKATVPSVYRPALEDMIVNAQAELASAVASLTALIEVINGGSTTKGYINTYNSNAHKAGLSFVNPSGSTTVPSVYIDGVRYDLLENFSDGIVNGETGHGAYITDAVFVHNNGTGVSRIKLTIIVDNTVMTKYINLQNS